MEKIINEAWENRSEINSNSDKKIINAIEQTLDDLDSGKIRICEKSGNDWSVNQWMKKAILLSFRTKENSILKTRDIIRLFFLSPHTL